MERRDFLKLTPALPAVASVTLTAKAADWSDVFSADIGVLRVKPGDVVAIFVPGAISMDTVGRIQQYMGQLFQEGVKCAVFSDGMSIGVLRTDA